MVIRGIVIAALVGILVFVWVAGRPQPAAVEAQAPAASPMAPTAPVKPPPLFGPDYVPALRGVIGMEESDAAAIERQLASNPDDYSARLKLMAYWMRADRVNRPEDQRKRAASALWLIEHHPESDILHSPQGSFFPGQLTDSEYRRAVELWGKVSSAPALWNASHFFGPLDAQLARRYLERTIEAEPTHYYAGRELGQIYAQDILQHQPDAARAREQLDATANAQMVEAAVRMFQSEHNKVLMLGGADTEAGALAEHYFARALTLNPGLDRQWVMPQIEPNMVGMLKPGAVAQSSADGEARVAEGLKKMRRLAVDAFPDLPPAIADALRGRGCAIPQPMTEGDPKNVIHGEFFEQGRRSWAAFCSKNGSTDLLVFRDDLDPNPMTINTREEKTYLQSWTDGDYIYSREITPVARDFILGHYRAYGGPEPPPIDHQGIDDAFLEKASVTYYFYEGKWLQLQGAD